MTQTPCIIAYSIHTKLTKFYFQYGFLVYMSVQWSIKGFIHTDCKTRRPSYLLKSKAHWQSG